VKVAVVEIMVIRRMVLVVEKVVVKERPQMLVVVLNMDLVLVALRVLRYVKRVELILH
jgi:hypothetical protein